MNVADIEALEVTAKRKWPWFPLLVNILTVLASIVVLLISAVIVLLLASVLFPASHPPRGNALRVWAKNDTSGVTAAIKAYYTEYGTMPTGSNAEIMRALRGDNPRKIVIFETQARNYSPSGELLDPWKQPYRIDTSDPGKPWVYSKGPDKQDNGGVEGCDDVTNWR